MLVHALFDILAWVVAALCYWLTRDLFKADPAASAARARAGYRIALVVGAAIGAYLFGSLNLWLSGVSGIGRSIEGSLIGAAAGVEIYKFFVGISARTGAAFVLPLMAGIAVGRLGCLFAGLEDFTHGIPTGANWGWDFGDGLLRHPVQLYEAIGCGAYAGLYAFDLRRGRGPLLSGGFGLAVAFYGAQRFAWEFLKPYASVLGPLTIFHLLSAALVVYGLYLLMTHRNEPPRTA